MDNLTTSKAVDALLNAETVALFGNRQLEVRAEDRGGQRGHRAGHSRTQRGKGQGRQEGGGMIEKKEREWGNCGRRNAIL